MSTACFDLARSIPGRIGELRVLIGEAGRVETEDEGLYNAICRATCVLLASHLEGFLKELASSIVSDLNYHVEGFAEMPAAVQRTFCKKIAYYEGVQASEIETRVKQLMTFFGRNSVNVDMTAFPYKESANKNPNPNVIEKALEKLGVPDVLWSIATPAFEVVFDNDQRTNYRLTRDLRRMVSKVYRFPFQEMVGRYGRRSRPAKSGGAQTLWHTFVEEIMTRRHSIAHGDTLSNDTSWEELNRDSDKLDVLMHGILFSSASYVCRGL